MAIYLGTDKVSLAGTNGGFMLNGRLIATKEYEFKLSDTNYSSLTISTTAQTLTLPATTYTTNPSASITCYKLSQDYDGTVIDLYNHDYVIFFEQVINYAYSSSVSGTIHGLKSVYSRDLHEGRYYSSFNASTGQLNTSANPNYSSSYITSQYRLLYQKTDNTYATTSNYGIKSSTTPAQFGVTNGKGYINLNVSSIQAQANDSYFPVTAMDALDTENTKIKSTWYIYEGDKSIFGQIYSRSYELATV